MNLFELISVFINKNFKNVRKIEDSDERKKQWLKIIFGILLALGYGGLHVPPDVSMMEIIYALGILFMTLYVVIRALKYFKLI
tara:strand:- start:80 stop:328 length:249 start_codon:yes stop_codon:yes gene_type:complete